MSGRRRTVTVGAGVLVAATAAVVVLVGTGGDDAEGATDEADLATATVQRTDLVRTEELDGELGYAESRPVVNHRQGTLTSVTPEGTVVDRGGVLYRIDEEPVVLLLGEVPAYRDLDTDVEGADVRQLEENLQALGYGGDLTVDDDFTSATAAAYEDFEEAVGIEPDGVATLGEVVFLPAPVRLGAAMAELGSSTQAGAELVEASATGRVVTVTLEAADDLAVDDVVSVELPDGNVVDGTVTVVETTVTTSTGSSSSPFGGGDSGEATTTTTATAVLDGAAVAAWDEAAVDVRRQVQRADGVLAVPVTALVALAEGGYGLQVVDGEAAGTRYVAVTVGMYTDDLVEVSGEGISEGTEVVVPA